MTREWIEILTGPDPDGGSGPVEFGPAVGLLAVAALRAWSARRTHVSANA